MTLYINAAADAAFALDQSAGPAPLAIARNGAPVSRLAIVAQKRVTPQETK